MRVCEIASAEEQIELWKLVTNSVWQALARQQRAEQQRRAQAAARKPVAAKKLPAPKVGVPKAPPRTAPSAAPKSAAKPPVLPATLQQQPLTSLNTQQQPAPSQSIPPYSVKNARKVGKQATPNSPEDTGDRHSKNTFFEGSLSPACRRKRHQ